jgi:hypothetical protein
MFKGACVDKTALAGRGTDGSSPSLWFDPPIQEQDRRHQLTRERVVAEALAVIAHDGVQALTMRRLAARLKVVPGALTITSATSSNFTTWSSTTCWPRSTSTWTRP